MMPRPACFAQSYDRATTKHVAFWKNYEMTAVIPLSYKEEAGMLRHLVAAGLVVLLSSNLGVAQTADPTAAKAPSFASDAANLRDPAQRAALSAIAGWLSQEFGLPQAAELPRIAFATPAEILRRRYRIMRGDSKQSAYETPAQSTVERTVAIYDDSDTTIYLTQDWRGDSVADVSVLVHEMVHHLQNLGRQHFACARER